MSNKPARGPPPGLGTNNKSNIGTGNAIAPTSTGGSATNGWIGSSLAARVGQVGGNNWSSTNNGSWPSTWLLLKNLTAQVRIVYKYSYIFIYLKRVVHYRMIVIDHQFFDHY